MIFPCQLGSAFATSGCDSKRPARKMTSALMASASDVGMISGPIAAASDAKLSGLRVVATNTFIPLRANALARALPMLPKPIIAWLVTLFSELLILKKLFSQVSHTAIYKEFGTKHKRRIIGSQENC